MRLLFLLLVWTSIHAQSPVLAPWRFGMSKAEVTSFEKFGPFKDVKSTGGTETFNGEFNGKKANISFVFDEKGLKRIQVWVYEGDNKEDASKAWASLYTFLKNTFGPVEVPDLKIDPKADPVTPETLAVAATVHAGTAGKTQMAPEKMPNYATIFSSMISKEIHGKKYYFLFLYCDRP